MSRLIIVYHVSSILGQENYMIDKTVSYMVLVVRIANNFYCSFMANTSLSIVIISIPDVICP